MIFKYPKGIIALDIDGTITDKRHEVHKGIVNFFSKLFEEQWQFIFITGRPFQWGYEVLKAFPFKYVFALQNGALILEMPERNVLSRDYLSADIFQGLDVICKEEHCDFVVYAGLEYGDRCYYRESFFNKTILQYAEKRSHALNENWIKVDSFENLPVKEFLSLKSFSNNFQTAEKIAWRLENELGLHAPVNKDPYNPNYFVIQATHAEGNKGAALKRFMELYSYKAPIIAAGDDLNDISMLKAAHVKIAMKNAPKILLDMADITAPLAAENGIILGLQLAISRLEKRELNF